MIRRHRRGVHRRGHVLTSVERLDVTRILGVVKDTPEVPAPADPPPTVPCDDDPTHQFPAVGRAVLADDTPTERWARYPRTAGYVRMLALRGVDAPALQTFFAKATQPRRIAAGDGR